MGLTPKECVDEARTRLLVVFGTAVDVSEFRDDDSPWIRVMVFPAGGEVQRLRDSSNIQIRGHARFGCSVLGMELFSYRTRGGGFPSSVRWHNGVEREGGTSDELTNELDRLFTDKSFRAHAKNAATQAARVSRSDGNKVESDST